MSVIIDKLLRSAKADIRAGQATRARIELLQALDRFPDNIRLLAQLAEVQTAATGLPARPFAAAHLQHFLKLRGAAGLTAAIEEVAAAVRLNPLTPWAQGVLGGALLEADLLPGTIPSR